MKKQNIIFMILLIIVMLLGWIMFIREEKTISYSENRNLQKFEHFTLKSYIKGEFQKNIEAAMSDQFIGSETIKLKVKSTYHFLNYNKIPNKICKNKYVYFDLEYANFNCDDYLLPRPEYMNDEIYANLEKRINNYNTINKNIDTYYYFVPNSKVFDFENNKYSMDIIKILEKKLKNEKGFKTFELNNYDDYTKHFYKTDHHWNYLGSYKGYKDIMQMLSKNVKYIEPSEKIIFDDLIFYGSFARFSQILDYKEIFKAYKYDLPDMKILTNKVIPGYGSEEEYFKGNINKNRFNNHYGSFYGDDYGEVYLEANSGKKNLLIIGNSYTNSVNKLIASHFNRTYDIDLRFYESTFNKKFNIEEYIEENDIDKVLILIDYYMLMNDKFNAKWGE